MSLSPSAAPLRWKILLALAIVFAAYWLRFSLFMAFHFNLSPYLTYLPAILFCAMALGMWPGLAATGFTTLLIVLTAGTIEHLRLLTNEDDIIALALSSGVCAAISVLAGQIGRNQRLMTQLESSGALKASEERYRTAFQTSLDIMAIASLPDCRSIDVNPRFTEEFGYTREEAIGKTSGELGLWVKEEEHAALLRAFEEGKPYRHVPVEFRKKDGTTLSGLASAERLEIHGAPCILISIRNVTAEKAAQEALKTSEARYRAAFETSPDTLALTRLSDGVFLDINPTFTATFGWKRKEVIGHSSKEINIWADYSNRDAMLEILRKGQDFRNVEIQFRRKDGSILWGNLFSTIIEAEGVPCLFLQMRDLTNEKRAEEEIRNLAFHDQITGLANRRLLIEQFRKSTAMSVRTRRNRALLFLDLDNFKTVNDSRGHITGDMLLREVANRLLACVNESDTVSRLGGDEFVIILEELHVNSELAAAQVMEVVERILDQVKLPFLLNDSESHTSCSIGISLLVDDKTDFTHAMQQAEIAMYQAKAAGRNTARFFAPGLQAAVNARATLEEEIRAGIERHQFLLYFQPQFEDDSLIGAEALLRWNHPRQGLLSPGEFIPLAEETRLIMPLGAWILEHTCRHIASWSEHYPNAHITVAVNISALELHRDDFVSSVLDILARTGANPEWLELEITETALVQDVEVAIAKMNALKAHGIRFALDDFGTGYSSLAYLKRLPLTQLKIDQSFVRDLMTDPSASPIARTIIALGKELGLRVMAEGVEFPEQRAMLESLGCHCHQGYLFSLPLPEKEFEQMLAHYSGNPALLPA